MNHAGLGTPQMKLYLFEEQDPSASRYASDNSASTEFRSECPPDAKIKVENLFSFKRKRGDLIFSSLMLVLALFFLLFFWTETGWDKRKLPDELGSYLLHQFGVTEVDGRVTRFGRILKQSWVAPMLCLVVFVPAALWNMRAATFVHRWRQRFLIPTNARYELEQWTGALEFIAYFIIYTLVVPKLGYLVSTLVFGVFLTYRLGYRTRKWLATSVLAGFAIVLVFRTFLQIKTPVNIWLYDQMPLAVKSFMLTYF